MNRDDLLQYYGPVLSCHPAFQQQDYLAEISVRFFDDILYDHERLFNHSECIQRIQDAALHEANVAEEAADQAAREAARLEEDVAAQQSAELPSSSSSSRKRRAADEAPQQREPKSRKPKK